MGPKTKSPADFSMARLPRWILRSELETSLVGNQNIPSRAHREGFQVRGSKYSIPESDGQSRTLGHLVMSRNDITPWRQDSGGRNPTKRLLVRKYWDEYSRVIFAKQHCVELRLRFRRLALICVLHFHACNLFPFLFLEVAFFKLAVLL